MAVLADTDSRWKWALATANSLSPGSLRCYLRPGPQLPSERQLRESGVDPADVTEVSLGDLVDVVAADECDVVILGLGGDAVQAVLQSFAARWTGPSRPILVAGYVGIVYERLVEGLYQRAGADVVIANSPADARSFADLLTAIGFDPSAVVTEPLPFLAEASPGAAAEGTALTFAAQPEVPSRKEDRRYLVSRLIEHARRHPERPVLLKVRGLAGESLTHPEPYPYQRLVQQFGGELPANFEVVAGSMSDALDRTAVLVTVSSTAAAESIHRGIPTAILTDFGVREGLGNHFFAGSGCYASFDELDEGVRPTADREWAAAHGLVAMQRGALAERIAALRSTELPAVSPYFSRRRSPVYLGRMLSDHGLDSQARPLHDGSRRRGRFASAVARRLYRAGAAIVAPALRRLGEG
ncbi:DUF6716 putative glycosyltransferase [Propionicimonas paludicola]|uniref:DUF6716 putative glycosyltransferase n=1 Tax=Propionicimonas paludicola TaxID=185243 RepID=UPI001179A76A|nr:DUF6716 putative glycosyltransferase [Propionicimonas paludicola]